MDQKFELLATAEITDILKWKYHCVYKGLLEGQDIVVHSNHDDDKD